MFSGLPHEFVTYMKYSRSLGFKEEPDYAYPKNLFKDLFIKEGYIYDEIFDWTVTKKLQ
jgi:hypothetical protein